MFSPGGPWSLAFFTVTQKKNNDQANRKTLKCDVILQQDFIS